MTKFPFDNHSTVRIFQNATESCPYGFKPYINSQTNALNPCFISVLSLIAGVLFVICGSIQLFQLYTTTKSPLVLRNHLLNYKILPKAHKLNVLSCILQATILEIQFCVSYHYYDSYPLVTKWNFFIHFIFVFFISLPTQYLQYFMSICSIGSQLFYYLFEILIISFQLLQRFFHYPNDDYNILRGNFSGILDIILLLNSMSIFFYNIYKFEPAQEMRGFYKENKWYPSTHIFGNLAFSWMNDLIMDTFRNGKLRDPDNLPLPPVNMDIPEITKVLTKNWEFEKWKNTYSIYVALWNTFWRPLITAIGYETMNDLLSILQPQFLRLFILCFSMDKNLEYPILHGVFIAIALFLTNICSTLLNNQFFIQIFEVGLGIRGSLAELIYDKSLKLSQAAKDEFSTGDIINYTAVDVLRIQKFFENSQTIIGAPLQIIFVIISLYFLLGNATFAGVIPMFLMMPINSKLSKKVKSLSRRKMKYNDSRIKTTTEILSSMKSIKLYCWEKPMLERLRHIRNDLELENLKKICINSNLIYFVWNCVPVLVTCCTFAVYAKINDIPLTPEIVFPSLSLLNLLNDAISTIPSTITSVITTNVSIDRVKKFLLSKELETSFMEKITETSDDNLAAVELSNATFLWGPPIVSEEANHTDEEESVEGNKVALKNIDYFQAKKKDLTCIVGRVGSGKTTLLMSIMGDLPCISGRNELAPPTITIRGDSIAYCPQEPWIMNDSIKGNILFGHRFDEQFYNLTINACQLELDLQVMPDGDETLVGEKGITLSGGQKARLSLARAVYARASIYILDDILSAVDSGVRKNIISKVLDRQSGILRNKTVILATNIISVLELAQKIYVMDNSEIIEVDTHKNAINENNNKTALGKLLSEFNSNMKSTRSSTSLKSEESRNQEVLSEYEELVDDLGSQIMTVRSRKASLVTLKDDHLIKKFNPNSKSAQTKEISAIGRVKWDVYYTYAKACGLFGVSLFFIFSISTKLCDLAQTFWVKHWSEENQRNGENLHIWKYVSVYAAIGVATVGFGNLRTIILLLYCTIRGSKKLHDAMALAVLRSPMQFFDTTPMGRILNRFSSDMDMVDTSLQHLLMLFFQALFGFIVIIALVSISMPLFLIFTSILMVFYVYYQRLFIVQSRELKRLTSVSYSPILALLSETLTGLSVIRAFGHFRMFKFLNNRRVQFSINCLFNYRSTNRWLSIRLQSIGAVIILITAMLALFTVNTSSPLSAGMVGLLMNYILQITTSLTRIVRSSVLLENGIVSVERIHEYCNLPSEADDIIQSCRPHPQWPNRGHIKFKEYTTSYRKDLDPVLKNINVEIQPNEKIGVVGRTGAGKSTLTLSLFRLIEPTHGTIFIDDIDISSIGLADLRSNMAIIPQDAQAFEGNVRTNLDPFSNYSDEELYKVVKLSSLEPHLIRLSNEENEDGTKKIQNYLNVKIKENGSNLSIGQRQLLCLARALLNKSKILVLDEATAAIDMETDRIIQKTIREEFKDRTIITIAHRLDTVLDSDRIVVLDRGEIKEFERPDVLLANKTSLFYELCEKGGYLKKDS